MTLLELLTKSRNRIASRDNWCTGTAAKTAHGTPCSTTQQTAVRFCALGALWSFDRVSADESAKASIIAAEKALRRASIDLFNEKSVVDVNDQLGHEAVLKVYDRAIQEVEAAIGASAKL
jgi:hypothetical protein